MDPVVVPEVYHVVPGGVIPPITRVPSPLTTAHLTVWTTADAPPRRPESLCLASFGLHWLRCSSFSVFAVFAVVVKVVISDAGNSGGFKKITVFD